MPVFFNKVEEVKCAISVALCQRRVKTGVEHGLCDCIAIVCALNQQQAVAHKREFAYDWVPGDRVQGYRIKRLSACGGCLGDHRR